MRRCAGILVTVLMLAGCAGDDGVGDDDWGPLAVVGPQNGVMEALTQGTLRITDACVYLEEGESGTETLLIWAANWTRWDAQEQAVLYAPFGDAPVRLHDGDRVSLGGGGASIDEGGVPDRAWVNPPDASCPTGQVWSVGEVVGVEEG